MKFPLAFIGVIKPCCDTIEVQTGTSYLDGVYHKGLSLSGGRAYYSSYIEGSTRYLHWRMSTANWIVSTVFYK